MSPVIRWSCLVVGILFLASPSEAQNKNKPKPGGKGTDATPQEYQAVLAAGEVTGKITDIDHAKRLVTIQVETQAVQAGGNVNQNLARQQQQLMRNAFRPNNKRNPAEQARHMQQQAAQLQRQQMQALNRNNGGGPKINTVKKDFEFQADPKARVRLLNLPQEFDERGKPKQYTQAELRELKGPNTTLPGYQSTFEDLHPGQIVKLSVASAKKTSIVPPAANKNKDVDADKEMPVFVPDGTKPRTTMIVIVKDETNPSGGKGQPKKKK
jgi:hypothetical protein